MINSTFGGFMTARLGMSVSQSALNIVGQNITNVGTTGYTRQRLDQVSLNVGGGSNRYGGLSVNIGNGAIATGTSQIRDIFLDRRFRNEMAQVGEFDILTNGLTELADILDESTLVNDEGGILNALGDFKQQLDDLSANVGSKEFDTMVRVSADSLCKLFNSYAKDLQAVKDNTETDFVNVDVQAVNDILKQITELNESIKSSQIYGDSALELQDQRNLLIDELSTYMKIDVQYDPVKVTESVTVDELKIYLPDMTGANGGKFALIDDDECRQFITEKQDDGTIDLQISSLATAEENAETGVWEKEETLLNWNENNPDNTTAKKVNDILKKIADWEAGDPASGDLDTLVSELENLIDVDVEYTQTGDPLEITGVKITLPNVLDAGGNPIVLADSGSDSCRQIIAQQSQVEGNAEWTFSVSGSGELPDKNAIPPEDDPTAWSEATTTTMWNDANISTGSFASSLHLLNGTDKDSIAYYQNALDMLANQFAMAMNEANVGDRVDPENENKNNFLFAGESYQINGMPAGFTAATIKVADGWANNSYGITATHDTDAPEGANDNVMHMITLMSESLTYMDENGNKLFEGSFQEFFSDIGVTLGMEISSNENLLNNHVTLAGDVSDARESVSGVSLDEEGMNMMQYSKAYTASARLMTTLDEMLSTLLTSVGAS